MSALHDLAQQSAINSEKPFFPVNSLRLLYFLITNHFSQDAEVPRTKITALIPLVEAIFDARSEHRANNPGATAQTDWETCTEHIKKVYEIIDTPIIRQMFSTLFSYLYPLQDNLFLSLYQEIMSKDDLTKQTLSSLLQVRAMDSLVFSTLMSEINAPYGAKTHQESIHHHIHLAYQINDLVDAIVFAKDDIDANNFSPFQVIRKIAPESDKAKELITGTFQEFKDKAAIFPFPDNLQAEVEMYYQELMGVVRGE